MSIKKIGHEKLPVMIMKLTDANKDGKLQGQVCGDEMRYISVKNVEFTLAEGDELNQYRGVSLRISGTEGSEGFSIFLPAACQVEPLINDLREARNQLCGFGIVNCKN